MMKEPENGQTISGRGKREREIRSADLLDRWLRDRAKTIIGLIRAIQKHGNVLALSLCLCARCFFMLFIRVSAPFVIRTGGVDTGRADLSHYICRD